MPVRELVEAMGETVPGEVRRVSSGLQYRDFVTVGLLLRKLKPTAGSLPGSPTHMVPDNWIYVQDKGVSVGRLQIFNNWSPWMVADPNTVWIGMEYFCAEGDGIWSMADEHLKLFAVGELEKLGLADQGDLLDGVVLRVPKAYPGYYGTYNEFPIVRDYMDAISNLFLVGRNGMHRYNNQDHSMLTARYAAQAIVENSADKTPLWEVNVDDEYHEEKTDS
jgi:protoporphyrinogen oxidase